MDHPGLVPWESPPRRRRIREPIFELPEGFEPLNPDAYRKRFGHMLQQDEMVKIVSGRQDVAIPAVKSGSPESA